jgi:hypothetical protein
MDLIANPADLLEAKRTIVLDMSFLREHIATEARQLFHEPISGVYLKNKRAPLFTAHEALYTHPQSYKLFPEIAQPVYHGLQRVKEHVGDRIDWRQAVNNQVNVYNAEGVQLLSARSKRSDSYLVYNPGPEIFASDFILEVIRMFVLENTHWGDHNSALIDIHDMLLDDVDVSTAVSYCVALAKTLFDTIREFINEDKWALYCVRNIGDTLIIESSCDWRHYKLNEKMIADRDGDQHKDLYDTFKDKTHEWGEINYDDLEEFFDGVFKATGYVIKSIPELFEILELSKTNKELAKNFTNYFQEYKKGVAVKNTRASLVLTQLLGNKNDVRYTHIDQGDGKHLLQHASRSAI